MASAAQQIAAIIGFATPDRHSDFKMRLSFTLGALLVYRLGAYIPVPGIDAAVLRDVYLQLPFGMFDVWNLLAGGALFRTTIFIVGIGPYVSLLVVMLLLTTVSPRFKRFRRDDEAGPNRMRQYLRCAAVLLALVQAYGFALGVEGTVGSYGSAVVGTGEFFRLTTVLTLVGGAVFLMWLGDQISTRGIGHGVALIVLVGILAELPRTIGSAVELGRFDGMSLVFVVYLVVMIGVAISAAALMFMDVLDNLKSAAHVNEQAARPVPRESHASGTRRPRDEW